MIISGTTINIDDITIDGTSIKTLKSRLEAISADNAAAHNSIYRGKNLGTSITAAQMNAVKNGSFDDLYLGDYWALPIDGTTCAYITGCDIRPNGFANTGLARKTTHTICVWFQNNNWLFPVNDTDTTEGHLKGSKMYTETLPELLTKIQTVIPDEYFNIIEDYIADAANSSGGKTHVVAEAMKLFIPSAYNLGIVDTIALNNTAYNMTDKTLWPYSVHRPQTFGYACWLSSPASATTWHYKDAQGGYIHHTQTTRDDALHVWPYAYLGIQ